jgi:hypothetical protein
MALAEPVVFAKGADFVLRRLLQPARDQPVWNPGNLPSLGQQVLVTQILWWHAVDPGHVGSFLLGHPSLLDFRF